MVWLPWKTPNKVGRAVKVFEVASTSQQLFTSLGKDLDEEAFLKSAAKRDNLTGGWASQQGRVHDNILTRSFIDLTEFISKPMPVYLRFALVSFAFHVALLTAWGMRDWNEGTGVNWGLFDRTLEAATASDTVTRLAVMYVCGHILWAGVVVHALVSTDVLRFTPMYLPLVLLCVALGGPACGIAVSAHCESDAYNKALAVAVSSASRVAQINAEAAEEKRATTSNWMQWLYLLILATMVAGSASAFGAASLDLTGDADAYAVVYYTLWPLDLMRSGNDSWMTCVGVLVLSDWVAIVALGCVLAVSHAGTSEPILSFVGYEHDNIARCAVVLIGAFPSPYIGLALYLLLHTRAQAPNPLLPECTGGLRGPQKPRAMVTWQARVQAAKDEDAILLARSVFCPPPQQSGASLPLNV